MVATAVLSASSPSVTFAVTRKMALAVAPAVARKRTVTVATPPAASVPTSQYGSPYRFRVHPRPPTNTTLAELMRRSRTRGAAAGPRLRITAV